MCVDLSSPEDNLSPSPECPSVTVKEDDSELDSVIMMGWLEKYSPQGYDWTGPPHLEVLHQAHAVSVCLSQGSGLPEEMGEAGARVPEIL